VRLNVPLVLAPTYLVKGEVESSRYSEALLVSSVKQSQTATMNLSSNSKLELRFVQSSAEVVLNFGVSELRAGRVQATANAFHGCVHASGHYVGAGEYFG